MALDSISEKSQPQFPSLNSQKSKLRNHQIQYMTHIIHAQTDCHSELILNVIKIALILFFECQLILRITRCFRLFTITCQTLIVVPVIEEKN